VILRKSNPLARDDVRSDATGIEDIARRLDQLVQAVSTEPGASLLPAINDGILNAARRAWKARRERQRIFGHAIIADPGWDILLALFIARIERREVTVSGASSAIGVSAPTLLRWVAQLIEAKLVSSAANGSNPGDRFLTLTDEGVKLMCDYFLRTGPDLDLAAA